MSLFDFDYYTERYVEDWCFENIRGNLFRCACGEWEELDKACQISPDPYSIPVCQKCFDTYFRGKNNEER